MSDYNEEVETIKKLRFMREAFFIAVGLYPLDWGFSIFYDDVVVSLTIGPLLIDVGNPFWIEEIDPYGNVLAFPERGGE